MRAINTTRNREVSFDVTVADRLFSRMKGLLGRDALGEGESLWIKPCNSIHTIGMKFPIDVVFLDQSEKVVHINHRLPANRITGVYFKAASVLELPVGVLKDTGTEVGDTIHFY